MCHSMDELGALSEPIPWETTTLTGAQGYLVPGVNVLAVHGFNSSLGASSDFVFDARLSSITDVSPPVVESTVPVDRALVRSLNTIEVIFSEAVTGVDAADLLINGVPATGMTLPGPRQFLFHVSGTGDRDSAGQVGRESWDWGHVARGERFCGE